VRRRLGCGHHCWRVPGKKLARHSHGRASAARRFGTLAAAASLVHATRRARSCTPTAWTTRDCWWSAPKSCAACVAWRAQRGGGSERVQKQHAATVQTHADGCYSHKHVLVAHASAPAVTTSQAPARAGAPSPLQPVALWSRQGHGQARVCTCIFANLHETALHAPVSRALSYVVPLLYL